MLRVLKQILTAIAALFALLCATVAIVVAVGQARLNRETERKISVALSSHYPGDEVSVTDRTDFGYSNQICFEVTLRSPKTGSIRRNFVMINGDDDGGTWRFGSIYETMRDCEDHFDRG